MVQTRQDPCIFKDFCTIIVPFSWSIRRDYGAEMRTIWHHNGANAGAKASLFDGILNPGNLLTSCGLGGPIPANRQDMPRSSCLPYRPAH